MNKQLKNFLKGVGSIMNIAPTADYSRFVPQQSANDRMKGHWERTGKSIRNALDRFADESKENK